MTSEPTHERTTLGDLVRRFLRRAFPASRDDASEHEFKRAHLYSISEMERERYVGRRYRPRGKSSTPWFSRPMGVPPLDAEVGVHMSVDDRLARAAQRRPESEEGARRASPGHGMRRGAWAAPALTRLEHGAPEERRR